MRELQVCPSSKRKPAEAVSRLAFGADGGELVAWVGCALHAYDLRTDTARVLFDDEGLSAWGDWWGRPSELLLSPDRRLVAAACYFDDNTFVQFEGVPGTAYERESLPAVPVDSAGFLGLTFTADGTELVAARNRWEQGDSRDVARFDMSALTAPPKRYVQKVNPLSGQPYQAAVRNLKWKHLLDLPAEELMTAVSLSANGRRVAVGTQEGAVHVADLKKKTVLASFAWEGRKLRDRIATRVGFDPSGTWVAALAGGRLFVRPVGEGTAWRPKESLGRATDFAYHPDGRALCAVFADGQARFFDPHSGNVRQSFRWSKRPLHSVAFAPDGLTCAVGSTNGKVVVWDVDV